MQYVLERINETVADAFEACGYDREYGKVTVSNRPDLCEYQCNGAMACAKAAKKAPFMIADEIAEKLSENKLFAKVESVKPGFLNMDVSTEYLAEAMNIMEQDDRLGMAPLEKKKTIIVDYGGANVAKPLHVGHLRPAVIGEAIKRMLQYVGHEVYGDVHLGDWGLQIGLIIRELKARKPELPYWDENYTGEYPTEAPFTISDLEEIYPYASKYSKEHEDYMAEAHEITNELQNGHRAYRAVLDHILKISHEDLKKNYGNLNVNFELWLGESDAQPFIPPLIEMLKEKGIAREDEGALIVDVAKPDDKREIPPCLIQKSDGAALYATTDLGTIAMRKQDQDPDAIIYVVDKRQELHFIQVFRVTRMAQLVTDDVELTHVQFGTMNGKDGKPFKTRDGGLLRLENMIKDIEEDMFKKITENHETDPDEARETARKVALAALKYGDLSNQAAKDYVFDLERFTSFEGNTGPYLLYSIVRIKSILNKYAETGKNAADFPILPAENKSQKELMLQLSRFQAMMENAAEEYAPHKVCAYVYELANCFNRFYHENNIMAEADEKKQGSLVRILDLTKRVMETCIDVLGFEAPDRM